MRRLNSAHPHSQVYCYLHMNGAPKVSIVVATYNRARFLPATIESVLQQRYQDFELIVVDDGSTDDTEKALQPYRQRLIYCRQENRGPSSARNAGVRLARAPWIAIQDSDDLCAPNYLESLYNFASAHRDCGMVDRKSTRLNSSHRL